MVHHAPSTPSSRILTLLNEDRPPPVHHQPAPPVPPRVTAPSIVARPAPSTIIHPLPASMVPPSVNLERSGASLLKRQKAHRTGPTKPTSAPTPTPKVVPTARATTIPPRVPDAVAASAILPSPPSHGLRDFTGFQPQSVMTLGSGVLNGAIKLLGPDSAPLPAEQAQSMRPGEALTQSMIGRLSTRIIEDAVLHHRISRRDFYLVPPIHLTGNPSSTPLKHMDELHRLTCERSHHPNIFIPF